MNKTLRGCLFAAPLLFALVSSPPAVACSCADNPPPVAAVARADAVFTGIASEIRIIRKWQKASGDGYLEGGGFSFQDEGIGYTPVLYTRFDVIGVWKGVEQESVWVRSGFFSSACGHPFKIGDRYLVYAYWDDTSRVLATSLCTRTAVLRYKKDPEDLAALPPPSNELYDRRRQRIAQQLEAGQSVVLEGNVP